MKLQEDKHYLLKNKDGKIQKVFINEVTQRAYNIQAMDGCHIGWIQKEVFEKEYEVVEEVEHLLASK